MFTGPTSCQVSTFNSRSRSFYIHPENDGFSASNECFSNREFAFILKDDVHLRYRSYPDGISFERDCQAMSPYKIDIGAIYSASVGDSVYYV